MSGTSIKPSISPSRRHSTLHRVVNTTGQDRFSLPLFFEPNFDALVVALDSVRQGGRLAHGCRAC